ncbi:MAG: hypothetical protein ACREXR_11335 [Gammaproteobacteria bacterium]
MSLIRLLCLMFIALHGGSVLAADERTVVLAASATSDIPPLTVPEIRKLFLGVPLDKHGKRIIPLLNNSNRLLYEVFLQNVAFMSAPAYEQQVLSIVFRLGGKRPDRYLDPNALLDALRKNPEAVTYLWDDQVREDQDIKLVSKLWTGSVD